MPNLIDQLKKFSKLQKNKNFRKKIKNCNHIINKLNKNILFKIKVKNKILLFIFI